MSLPECVQGIPTFASTRRWYKIVRPPKIPNMTICEACYLDRAGWREDIARHFDLVTYPTTSQIICDFTLPPMLACLDVLLGSDLFDVWHRYASLVMSKPSCDPKGIRDGEWYGLLDPKNPAEMIPEFDLCAACHEGWNWSAGLGYLFRRLEYSAGTTRLCDFNPAAPRSSQFIGKWKQMFYHDDPTTFIDFVSRIATLPTCQGSRPVKDAAWYGDEDACLLICPSCFEEVVHDTYFAATFPIQNCQLPGFHHCSLYSMRMRRLYAKACELQSLKPLLAIAIERDWVYRDTMPQLQAFRAKQQQQQDLLRLAGQHRASAVQTTALARGFGAIGGPTIASNFDPAVRLATLSYEAQRKAMVYDLEDPLMLELQARWEEVE
ncbi:MAG: hypothetical protein Q9220_007577 [cf. Caloplaca sp. 1 TL-2023]